MFYIHKTLCISPQDTFSKSNIHELHESIDNQLRVFEPAYVGVDQKLLRRMSKSCRISISAALPLIDKINPPDGIIIGTANGGMEDSMKFMKQIIDYDEGMLTPGNFVQSTANAAASQLGMLSKNHGYNITHVHKSLAFENAVLDAAMLLNENPNNSYLIGGVDEIALYNYNIECAAGWYKKEKLSNNDLYKTNSKGSIAGEGAAMFLVSNEEEGALAKLHSLSTLHSDDENKIIDHFKYFIENTIPVGESIDLFLSGENGDNRFTNLFNSCEALAGNDATIVRFKHMCGEYPTASAFALWLACNLTDDLLPEHMIKKQGVKKEIKNVLINNLCQGDQHSLMFAKIV